MVGETPPQGWQLAVVELAGFLDGEGDQQPDQERRYIEFRAVSDQDEVVQRFACSSIISSRWIGPFPRELGRRESEKLRVGPLHLNRTKTVGPSRSNSKTI